MRRDPRTITYLLAFFVVYLMITGILILFLRTMMLEDRIEEGEDLFARVEQLEAEMHQRAVQEQRVIEELLATSGARDFEEAYALIREEIDGLREDVRLLDERVSDERALRLLAQEERNDIVSRVQSFELINERMRARLALCLDELASCCS
jgi:hypothetical protein